MKTKLLKLFSLMLLLFGTVLTAGAYAPGDKIEVPMGLDGLKAATYGDDANRAPYYVFTVNEDGTTCTLTKTRISTSGVIPQQYRNNINIVIPGTVDGLTVTAIGSGIFDSCSHIKSITIAESIKKIGDDCFKGCRDLVSLDLGGVEEIGARCFYFPSDDFQTKLTGVDLSKVKVIGPLSFNGFPNLKDVTLSPDLESLGSGCFQGCPNVELTFPEKSRYEVIDNIVYECSGTGADKTPQTLLMLQPNFKSASVTLPATVTSIAGRAFEDNEYIQSIDLSNVKSIGGYAFMNCKNLTTVSGTENIETFGSGAFNGCSSLKEFTIGGNCTTTADGIVSAFKGCTGLQSFEVSENNPEFTSVDGVLFSKDGATLIAYMCDNKTEYTVPAGVTTVAKGAFVNVGSKLTDLTIGNDVTTIGEDLFKKTAVSLENLTIGPNVKSIGTTAFYECPNINLVNCQALVPPTIPSRWIFSYNTNNNATILVPLAANEAYKSAAGWKDLVDRITSGVTDIVAGNSDEGVYYNLQGVRVDNPCAGQIYIRNGKKLIFR